MRSLYCVMWMLLALVLGGCALSPQTVDVRPSIDPDSLARRADGRKIALDVADNRGSAVIGTRGGIYSRTSEIRTGANIKTAVRNEVSRALQAMGYRVAEGGEPADAALTVIIDNIDYNAIGENVVKAVEITAILRVVSRVENREYTGRYRSKRTTDVLTAPGIEENEQMINAVISHVLERVLTDAELHKFMQG